MAFSRHNANSARKEFFGVPVRTLDPVKSLKILLRTLYCHKSVSHLTSFVQHLITDPSALPRQKQLSKSS